MTTEQAITVKPDVLAEHERQAAEAYERIKSGQHWTDWRYLAIGLNAGRQRAMRETYTNQPEGSAYNKAFGRWMSAQAQEWPRKLDKPTRNHLLWVADHLAQVEAWRETLATNERMRLNHPTAVKRRYERAMQAKVDKEAGRASLSPVAQYKQQVVELQEDRDKWKRRAEEGGSLFDLRRDKPEDIARIIVEQCSSSRVEKLITELRREQRKQKAAHAG